MEQQRQDADYSAFVTELHRRLAASGSGARFEAGMNPWLFWIGAVLMVAIGVFLAVFMGRTALKGDLSGLAIIGAVALLFAWQTGTMFHRNRPLTYRPEQIPPAALPRA
jgi:hypothetical protein